MQQKEVLLIESDRTCIGIDAGIDFKCLDSFSGIHVAIILRVPVVVGASLRKILNAIGVEHKVWRRTGSGRKSYKPFKD